MLLLHFGGAVIAQVDQVAHAIRRGLARVVRAGQFVRSFHLIARLVQMAA